LFDSSFYRNVPCNAILMSYDRALTIFSPDGHLFQVEYALEAVNRGTAAIGVRGVDVIVLAVEKKSIPQLQDSRTVRKICNLDQHICMAFTGLNADARVLAHNARVECQNRRLNIEDPASVEYISRYIAKTQQKYTQRGGARPFGVSTLLAGFDMDGKPRLFLTDPSGTHSEWKANAIGRGSKTIREFMEKSYESGMDRERCIKLAIGSLLEGVQTNPKNIEVVTITVDQGIQQLPLPDLDMYVAEIEKNRAKEAEQRKRREESR
jgi:20S proteasome subunit alpha 4